MRPILSVVALAAMSSAGFGQQLRYSGSLSVASGDYLFTERTRSVYFSNGISAEVGRLTVSASVPLVLQDSPWISYSIAGTLPTGGTDGSVVDRRRGGGPTSGTGGSETRTPLSKDFQVVTDPVVPVDTVSYSRLGVGDPGLRIDVRLLEAERSRPALTMSASLKPPLADASQGFGTGAWDGALGAGTSVRVGRLFLFAGGEHWWFGDMPELRLRNAWSINVAVGVALVPGRLAMLVSYSGFTRIIDTVAPPRQVALAVSLTPGRRYGFSLTTSAGLSEGASDYSAGVGWNLRM